MYSKHESLSPLPFNQTVLRGIAQIIDTDEYEVEEVLENWLELLQQK
ncbi:MULTISPECIES: hypothetical protein [unclassified Nostoc]|nr:MULTISPECIES: hypothetical protein [unclassified Nostoc]MBE8997823.1 hypothetical protein [Nostoc sp. LEGE 12447]NEU78794.1 hypothetical protein [Nostoc sp. UIC 10630]